MFFHCKISLPGRWFNNYTLPPVNQDPQRLESSVWNFHHAEWAYPMRCFGNYDLSKGHTRFKLGGGFETSFIFSPTCGKWSNLTNIFQMSWNHQLVNDSMHLQFKRGFFEPSILTQERVNSLTATSQYHWLDVNGDPLCCLHSGSLRFVNNFPWIHFWQQAALWLYIYIHFKWRWR